MSCLAASPGCGTKQYDALCQPCSVYISWRPGLKRPLLVFSCLISYVQTICNSAIDMPSIEEGGAKVSPRDSTSADVGLYRTQADWFHPSRTSCGFLDTSESIGVCSWSVGAGIPCCQCMHASSHYPCPGPNPVLDKNGGETVTMYIITV